MAGKKKAVTGNGITLNTIVFKDMVSKARKGASNNSILAITSMMAIELKDNKLTLITTDATNYLYVIQDGIKGDDFYATVMSDVFCQLVAKTTSENITLELKDNYLEFTGNGTYKIELPTDENGDPIKFTDPRDSVELSPLDSVHLADIEKIVKVAKSSLATTMEEPHLTGYYCGDEYTIATDMYKLCKLDCALWKEPKLISSEMMDLLTLMTAQDISVMGNEDTLLFTSIDCQVYGKTMSMIDDYPAEDIASFIECEYQCHCKVDKGILLQLLDRLSLFVTKTDKNEILLSFTKDGLQVTSKGTTGTELIKYIEVEDDTEEPFNCTVDIESLNNQLKSLELDTVEIHYHNVVHTPEGDLVDNVLKFVENDAIVCVSLLEDEE